MTTAQFIVVVILLAIIAAVPLFNNRHSIKRWISDRLTMKPGTGPTKSSEQEPVTTENEAALLSAEESAAELFRLQMLIEDRKRIAWNTDIAHHLWGLYKDLLSYANPDSLDFDFQDGQWYDIKILGVSFQNGLNKLEFELAGARYKFVDDEEKQGWRELTKAFSLLLHDESDRILIDIPMKMKVDDTGRNYSISTGGPNAFLLGGWINDFINVKLKHQSLRNQEIRAQKHQERLREIEDLKSRFGIAD